MTGIHRDCLWDTILLALCTPSLTDKILAAVSRVSTAHVFGNALLFVFRFFSGFLLHGLHLHGLPHGLHLHRLLLHGLSRAHLFALHFIGFLSFFLVLLLQKTTADQQCLRLDYERQESSCYVQNRVHTFFVSNKDERREEGVRKDFNINLLLSMQYLPVNTLLALFFPRPRLASGPILESPGTPVDGLLCQDTVPRDSSKAGDPSKRPPADFSSHFHWFANSVPSFLPSGWLSRWSRSALDRTPTRRAFVVWIVMPIPKRRRTVAVSIVNFIVVVWISNVSLYLFMSGNEVGIHKDTIRRPMFPGSL